MAPRNNDATTSYSKKKNHPVEGNNDDDQNILPSILHKKHKVVKLVKCQLQQIQEDGLICASEGIDTEEVELINQPMRVQQEPGEEVDLNRKGPGLCCFLFVFILLVLLLVLLMVWISAGPLSNASPRTPVLKGSFIQTEGLCSLEKKYLLRWGKPEYTE